MDALEIQLWAGVIVAVGFGGQLLSRRAWQNPLLLFGASLGTVAASSMLIALLVADEGLTKGLNVAGLILFTASIGFYILARLRQSGGKS